MIDLLKGLADLAGDIAAALIVMAALSLGGLGLFILIMGVLS